VARRRRGGILPKRLDPRRSAPPPDTGESQEIDASLAVLLDEVEAAETDRKTASGGGVYLLELSGRVNGSQDRAALPFLLTADGVANVLQRLMDLAAASPEVQEEVQRRLTAAARE
jgi:hypothetical protein